MIKVICTKAKMEACLNKGQLVSPNELLRQVALCTLWKDPHPFPSQAPHHTSHLSFQLK